MDDGDLIKGTAAWLSEAPLSDKEPRLSAADALRAVPEFLSRLADGSLSKTDFRLDHSAILVLRAACLALAEPNAGGLQDPLLVVQRLHDFLQGIPWPEPDFGERAELLADCAFAAWRISCRLREPAEEERWLKKFRTAVASSSPLRFEVERLLAIPADMRRESAVDVFPDDSELLLAVCEVLRPRLESAPMDAKAEAEFFYGFLDKPVRRIGLFNEREYYLGEFALMAATACRVLFQREEARRWFDSAEGSFAKAANGLAHVARVGCQRLALAVEERRFDEVFDLAPLWAESFRSMGLADDALKCRFFEGAALRETGRFAESVEIFRDIYSEAEKRGNSRLAAHAATSLAQYLRLLGNFDEALEYGRKALPLLKQLDIRMVLVKLQWSVANILREQGKLREALPAYREALEEARAIGMRGDVAALHLVLADVLLDAGQDRQAEWEVRAALPIIDEARMVPEGFAALDLLRQALRYRQIDRKALRDLHGYFGDSKP